MDKWEELYDFIERVTGNRPQPGQLINEVLAGLTQAYAELETENERLREALQEIADGKHEAMLTSNPPKNAATEYAKVVLTTLLSSHESQRA